MKNLIRTWLGLDKIQGRQLINAKTLNQIEKNQAAHLRQLKILYTGIGRIIAKIDPEYSRDELDPKRKAESDKIGEQVMNKLIGEHLARQHSNAGES